MDIFASPAGSSSTVGCSVVSDRRPPPVASVAPPATASSTHSATRSTSRGRISGPDLGVLQHGIADPQRLDARDEPLREVVGDLLVHVDALRRHADLAGVVVAALDDRLDDLVEIGAAVDDGRRRAAVLQRGARPGGELGCRDQPTRAEPMKLRKATRGSVAELLGQFVASGTKLWHHGSGRPASCTSATNSRQDSGVVLAGLTMTGQPTAIAGAT